MILFEVVALGFVVRLCGLQCCCCDVSAITREGSTSSHGVTRSVFQQRESVHQKSQFRSVQLVGPRKDKHVSDVDTAHG